MIPNSQIVDLTPGELIAKLRDIPVFASLPESEMQCLLSGKLISLPADEILARQGESSYQDHRFAFLLEGAIHVSTRGADGGEQVARHLDPGMPLGELPLLMRQPVPVTARTATPVVLLTFTEDQFWSFMGNCPNLRNIVLNRLQQRISGLHHFTLQQEKLVSLGTLTAGLMHELNNPGAAASRSASQLRGNLQRMHKLGKEFAEKPKKKEQMQCISALQERVFNAAPICCMSSLEEADAEESMATWLEGQNVPEAWRIAPTLVSIGITVYDLECARVEFDQEGFSSAIAWLEAMVSSMQLVGTIEESIQRVTALVKAVKSYTYEGRANQPIDLNESVHATLVLLKHKFREKNLTLQKTFTPNLPPLIGTPGLNQIWTNLLDNAIDAAPPEGQITIRTGFEDGKLFVSIADNGAGIPAQEQHRLFDPFYTTKPIGVGTGLGLGIAKQIAEQAGGKISFTSVPGNTEFVVTLPASAPVESQK